MNINHTESFLDNSKPCPLCRQRSLVFYFKDKRRHYWQCSTCELVSVSADDYLSETQEKAEYDKHDNLLSDPGYCNFLNRTWGPLKKELQKNYQYKQLTGLDFGCGEGAVLAKMINQDGFCIDYYDLYYHYYPQKLLKTYDFITLTEVIEHIANPSTLFSQLYKMLNPSGILAIMTKRVIDKKAFSQWHYKNDLTHINFYSVATFSWLENSYDWTLQIINNDLIFLKKS